MIALTLALLAAPAPPVSPSPSMVAATDTLRADQDLNWNLPVRLVNPRGTGFYTDSLVLEMQPIGADGIRLPPIRLPMPWLARLIQPVGAGESGHFQIAGSAQIERGSMTVRLHGHDSEQHHYDLSAKIVVAGGELFDAHPSRVTTIADQRVEWVAFAPAEPVPGAPGVLLVPALEDGARAQLRAARRLAQQGMHVVVVSLPGSGSSSGPADLGGPASQAAIRAGHDVLRAQPGVDPKRIVLWGVRDGAAPVLLAAADHADIAGVIAEAGDYDPWASYRAGDEARRAAILAGAGTDSASWRARSALLAAGRIRAAVLLLHAEQDPRAPASAAHALERALAGSAREVRGHYGVQGDRVPIREVTQETRAFLERVFAR